MLNSVVVVVVAVVDEKKKRESAEKNAKKRERERKKKRTIFSPEKQTPRDYDFQAQALKKKGAHTKQRANGRESTK